MSQVIVDALISWGWISVVALSFAMIFRSAGFLVFTHGTAIVVAPYLFALSGRFLNLPGPLAAVFAIGGAAAVASCLDLLLYRPLRRKGASPLAMFLASLGAVVVFENILSLVFGDAPFCLVPRAEIREGLLIAGAHITPIRMGTLAFGLIALCAVAVFLAGTRIGRNIRAVANDPTLALSCGVNLDWTIAVTVAVGSALAGAVGVLVGLDIDATPGLGMRLLLPGVLAAIIGGTRSWYGPPIGALVVSAARLVALWYFSSLWQDTLSFTVLLLVLLVRPMGLCGRQMGLRGA